MRYEKVSVMRAVDAARRKLELEQVSSVLSDFIEWVWEGEMKIGSTLTYERKECNISLVNGVGCLPWDVMYIMGLGHQGMNLEPSQADFQHFKQNVLLQGGNSMLNANSSVRNAVNSLYMFADNSSLKFSISGNKIRMMHLQSGEIALAYMGICTDDEGYPMVNDLHTDALSQYLVYMYTEREYLRGRAPAHVYDRMKERWIELCGQAATQDDMPNPLEMRMIAAIWNNVLPLPSLNNF